ncbi:ATP-binding protein [Alicyclobacillus sp. ALC3]|uniref:ATP-binding protein n=1 Tax=Alicyclobacillus sp. ALC3 TaxID=2796143 RepID=UPI0023780577|nr:ATP-binding protein [Alicyclobacillus sp. ALC3]WDL99173.1 HAMP domain-containing protein [Alicyclobacillus sp. ALC3]
MWRSIRVKLVAVYLLLILFSLQVIGAYFVRSLNTSLMRNETQTVKAQAQLIASMAAPEITKAAKDPQGFSSVLASMPQLINGSAYILNPQGVVLDTSVGRALIGQKRVDSVVTETTVSKQPATAIRVDPITNQYLLEVAVPITDQGRFQGVVEYDVPVQGIYTTIHQVTTIFYTASLVALLLTAALSVILAQTIARPVVEVTRQARHMAAGDFTRRVAVNSNDEFGELSTAINDLAEKLAEALAENARERDRLQAVITYMGEGVVVLDANRETVFVNDAAHRLLTNPEDQAQTVADLLGVRNHAGSDSTEGTFVRAIGDNLMHVHLTPMRQHGQVDGYVALIRDVTEQEKLNQARRDFVSNVSHELRTPLTSIKSYLEVLLDNQDADAKTQREFLGVIERETDRMVRLTQDLLHLSGLDSRQTPIRWSDIGVSDWLTSAVDRFQLQAASLGVKLEVQGKTDAVIRGDRDMLDRVLDNLLGNALKYTASGGRITLSAIPHSTVVKVVVADTGMGIPAEDLPHVFERFFRVDKARSRRRGGSGLGLALVREITELHSGRVRISSDLNVGTTVTVELPRRGVSH